MKKLLTNAQMRAADACTISGGVSGETLMFRAGKALADMFEEIIKKSGMAVTVVCGTGNNGGDGYVCARLLYERGVNVKVYAFSGRLSPDCLREKERYKGAYTEEIGGGIIVDCIFGTGLCREVGSPYKEVIEKINSSGAYVISADIPSGLNGDNGLIMGTAVKAHTTVAIGQLKQGFFLNDGLDMCGAIELADIGISSDEYNCALAESWDIGKFYPRTRKRNSHKGTYGSCEVIGGGKYAGAAALALYGAVVSGCGYVKLVCKDEVKNSLVAALPQVVYIGECDFNSDCIAIGMGSGVSGETYSRLVNALENYKGKLIIDADGLNCLAKYGLKPLERKKCDVILTPHVKEFSRISGYSIEEIQANGVQLVKEFAKKYCVTVILKSASAIVSDGERTVICDRGNSALAKGGSGDVLAGYICGTAARGVGLFDAAVCAHYIIGTAAEIASEKSLDYCVTYKEVLSSVPDAIIKILEQSR